MQVISDNNTVNHDFLNWGGGGNGELGGEGTPPIPLNLVTSSGPLQQYRTDSRCPCTIVVSGFSLRRARRVAIGGRLDLGSFLVGVEVSLRDSSPQMTAGLFGPLTNGTRWAVFLGDTACGL